MTKEDREFLDARREVISEVDENGEYYQRSICAENERRLIGIIDGLDTFA